MPRDDIRGEKWDLSSIPDLTGRVAIVTGASASAGIGWNVAHQLALKGAKVYVGARSAQKAEAAIIEMGKIATGSVQPLVMDIADLKQVRRVAQDFVASESRLDVLVNNAGVLARPLDKDANGISLSFVTNHLGPFVLTTELLPLLKKTAQQSPGVRIVTVSSAAHAIPPTGIKLDSIAAFNQELGGTSDFKSNVARYGLSKLANILFTHELQKRLDAEGIPAVAVALHPGGVKTAGAITAVGPANLALIASSLDPIDGALTPLFAATSPKVWSEKEQYAGAYLMPFGVPSPGDMSANARDVGLAGQLWEASERVIGDVLYTAE